MTEISNHERKNTPSFSLNQNEIAFISDMVAHGRFGNRTEVVRAGLRLLEDYENNMKLRRLRIKIEEAEFSIAEGKGITYCDGGILAQDIISRGEKRLNSDN
ncbi:MAG: type II toxin-antitoxin system ParD family antitoxin [Rickettsiales bacterium]